MDHSLAGGILKHLGLAGSGIATSSLVQDPSPDSSDEFSRFSRAGEVANPDIWSRYGSLTRRPVTFDSMLRLWEEMAGWDLIAAALVQIVDEACQTGERDPATLWFECNNSKIEDELNDMYANVEGDAVIPSQVWHIAGLGNHFEKIEYEPGDGVLGLGFAHPMDVRRYWLVKNRACIGYHWMQDKPDKRPAFKIGGQEITRAKMGSGTSVEDLWYPWDFMHFRRMYRLRTSEHGEPIFDEAQGIYKKLRIALDQMVVHRAQVQPDRYSVNIDVQQQPPLEQYKTVQRWKQNLRSKLSFGAASGQEVNDASGFRSFHDAMSLDTILWIARPTGFGHAIEKLAGTANVPDVYDIELLVNLFFSIMGMPKDYLMGGGGGGGEGSAPASGKALLATDMRFLRKIKAIRKPLKVGWEWLGFFHLLLKGHSAADLEDVEIQAKMSEISTLEDQMKLEMLKVQAEVVQQLGGIMETYKLPREAWIDVIFRHYMKLPDEVIDVFMTSLPAQMESGTKPPPETSRLIKEIEGQLGDKAKTIKSIRDAMDGKIAKRKKARLPRELKVLTAGKSNSLTEAVTLMKQGDVVASSFGENPTISKSVTESQKSPDDKGKGWARYNYGD